MSPAALHAIAAIALLSIMDAIIKALVVRLPVVEVAWLRYVLGSLIVGCIVAVARPGWPSRETIRANAARAVLVVVTATSFFYGLGQVPLAEALLLSFISPVVTAVLAALILGERLDRRVLLALLAGFAGVALIVLSGLDGHGGSAGGGDVVLGSLAILLSSVTYSASNVLLRARAQRDPLLTIVVIQNVAPCLILTGPGLVLWTVPDGREVLLLCAVGLLGAGGHLLLALAYAREEATRLAPLDYTALIWAVLIGYVAFAEVPSAAALGGGALIVGAATLASRR